MNTPHPSPTKADTQCGRILAKLMETPGEPVGLWDLYQVSGSMAVHSRISELRERGHHIVCTTTQQGKKVLSSYTLHIPQAVS
jgi:hypothetical protein